MICRVCKGTGKYIEYYSANDIVGFVAAPINLRKTRQT